MKSNDQKSEGKFLLFLAYLSPFLFPFYLFRFKFLSIPFTVLEVFSYLFFAALLFSVIFGGQKILWKKPAKRYYLLVLILLIGATLGVVTAPHFIALPGGVLMNAKQATLGIWKGWVLAPILYFFTFTQVVRSTDQLKKLLLYFIYAATLVALYSYFLAVFGSGLTYDLRLSGFFESANYLSLYLTPPLLLGIYFLLNDHHKGSRESLFNVASVTVMTHALLMTQSYAAIIAVFGSLFLYALSLLFKHKVKPLRIAIIFLALMTIFLGIVGSQRNSPKFKQFIDFEHRSSSTVRLEIYQIATNLIGRYPLTGVGPGLFQAYYQTKGPEILGKAPMEWNIPHPHNLFLAFYLNAGLLGFLAFLSILFLAHTGLTYPVMALWGILIHGLFDTPFWKNDLAMIFWLVIGSILILQIHGSSPLKERTDPIRKPTAPRHRSGPKTKKLKA